MHQIRDGKISNLIFFNFISEPVLICCRRCLLFADEGTSALPEPYTTHQPKLLSMVGTASSYVCKGGGKFPPLRGCTPPQLFSSSLIRDVTKHSF